MVCYLSAFFLTRGPLLFQKIPCHLVALVKDSAIFNYSSLGLFYCVYPLLTGYQLVCLFSHLIFLYLVLKLSNKAFFFLNRQTPLQNSHCSLQRQYNVGTHTTNLTSHALSVISFGFKV